MTEGRIASGRAHGSLGHQAYKQLRRRLITLDLRPGDKFTETQIMAELGIGKTPVREALALLVNDGLVRSRPRVGYEVAPITLQTVQDLYDLRLIVEPAAVRLAAGRVDRQRLVYLERLCAGEYASTDPDSIEEFLDANHDFHVGIAAASGNARLAGVVASVLEESRRFTHLRLRLDPNVERFTHEHKDLVHALANGDGEGASKLAYEQAEAARDEVIAALLANSRFMSLPLDFNGVRASRGDGLAPRR